jgi:hypothetical protein
MTSAAPVHSGAAFFYSFLWNILESFRACLPRLKQAESTLAEMEFGISTKWTDIFMRALTGVAVGLCLVGFVVPAYDPESGRFDGWAAFAGIGLSAGCALCLLISNAMAANAPICFGGGKWFSGAICIAAFVGGGVVSMNAMHLGWEVFKALIAGRYTLPADEHMAFAFMFVAFAKPGINWVIHAMEEIKWSRKLAEENKDRAERERRAERLAESEGRVRRAQEAESRRKNFRAVSTTAMAATAAFGIHGAAAAESPGFPLEESARTAPESADIQAHAAHGWKGPRDQAKWNLFKEAVRRGMTQKEIAEDLRLPTTTVHRWWHMLHPPEAANA